MSSCYSVFTNKIIYLRLYVEYRLADFGEMKFSTITSLLQPVFADSKICLCLFLRYP